MPPPGYEPFLATILDRPAEDGPRLVYADWLEEQGDADRAEFIRVQIELSGLTETETRHDRLTDRETMLLNRHGETWRADIPEWARPGCVFCRGFVEHVTVWSFWRRGYGESLSATCPVTKLTLQNVAQVIESFSPPHVRHLSELAVLDADMIHDSLMKLVHPLEIVASLKALRFLGARFGSTIVNSLVISEGLANLEQLELKRCGIDGHGAIRFTMEPNHLTSLRRLDLTQNNLESAGVWTLTDSEFVKDFTHVSLNSNEITDDGALALAESPYLEHLTHLELDDNHIGDNGLIALADRFPRLQRLSLARNSLVTSRGMSYAREVFGDRVRVDGNAR